MKNGVNSDDAPKTRSDMVLPASPLPALRKAKPEPRRTIPNAGQAQRG